MRPKMRIFHLAAGAADLYCGACQRDAALLQSLANLGHAVEAVALYTPLRADEDLIPPSCPIFYGGVNVYLQQMLPVFRWLPAWLDRFLASPALLRLLSSFAIETRPQRLGALTVSILAGREGRQAKELRRLISYLANRPRPDVISLSNSLLSGIAPALKEEFAVPIICSVQGEDLFVEALGEPFRSQARRLLRRHAKQIDLFIAPSRFHADHMVELLAVPPRKMAVVQSGVAIEKFRRSRPPPEHPLRVGYLAAITPAKGLDTLVNAMAPLAETNPDSVRLHIAGKVLNRGYWRRICRQLRQTRLGSLTHYAGELSSAAKVAFLQNLSAFVAPSRIPEPRALAALEALAAGVPIVAPRLGVFPEIIKMTNGGMLYSADDAADLRRVLQNLLGSGELLRQMAATAAEAISRHFSLSRMAEEFADLCARSAAQKPPLLVR